MVGAPQNLITVFENSVCSTGKNVTLKSWFIPYLAKCVKTFASVFKWFLDDKESVGR